jgi:hypothetical protein
MGEAALHRAAQGDEGAVGDERATAVSSGAASIIGRATTAHFQPGTGSPAGIKDQTNYRDA